MKCLQDSHISFLCTFSFVCFHFILHISIFLRWTYFIVETYLNYLLNAKSLLFLLGYQQKYSECTMYSESCWVFWGGALSDYFSAVNGVKQEAFLSRVHFCVYFDDLLLLLSKAGVDCYIGALAQANDCNNSNCASQTLNYLLKFCWRLFISYYYC